MSQLTSQYITEQLQTQFGNSITQTYQTDLLTLHVKKEKINEVLAYLKNTPALNFHFLTDLCGAHFPHQAGQELEVIYHLHNFFENVRIRIKTSTSTKDPQVPTATNLFPAANWMERETYDFYGIQFTQHPDLRRILNVDTMDFFPLRKEYPLEEQTRIDKEDKMFGR